MKSARQLKRARFTLPPFASRSTDKAAKAGLFVVYKVRSRPSYQIGADILFVSFVTLTFFFLAGFLVFLLSFLTLACRCGELGPGCAGSVPSSSDVLSTLQTRRGRRFSFCCCVLNPTSSVQSEYSLDSLNVNGKKNY